MALTVIATAYGGPEVLKGSDEPAAGPGPAQARIEVRAATMDGHVSGKIALIP